jgi:hypothetical protein
MAGVGYTVLSAEEINKAFHCFEQVLSDQKRMGWPNGIPVICINGKPHQHLCTHTHKHTHIRYSHCVRDVRFRLSFPGELQ